MFMEMLPTVLSEGMQHCNRTLFKCSESQSDSILTWHCDVAKLFLSSVVNNFFPLKSNACSKRCVPEQQAQLFNDQKTDLLVITESIWNVLSVPLLNLHKPFSGYKMD